MDKNALTQNYINAFLHRHETGCYKAPQEVVDYIVQDEFMIEDCEMYNHDACLDYDNLAVNAEIVEKDELKKEPSYKEQYEDGDFLFETKNFVVFSW